MSSNKTILIIMDGWGEGPKDNSNAIYKAQTPFIDSLYNDYPYSFLNTSGVNVGLPEGQMGNSEVGHINIGAGRIVNQELARINQSVSSKSIDANATLLKTFEYVKKAGINLHFIGLVSDGGVHSHQNHLMYLCELAHRNGINNSFIHAFTDGRDTDPHSGIKSIKDTTDAVSKYNSQLASVTGRYYAMDRDNRWERIKIAYDAMTEGIGHKTTNIEGAINESYQDNVTDEFIKPIISVDEDGKPIGTINENDAVVCFNFRTDRCRQIVTSLTQKDLSEHKMKTIPLHFVTMTNYDDSFKNINVLFSHEHLHNTLGEVLESQNKNQIRISETEKYPHVTYFFSGGKENEFKNEKRIMVASPKVATYDLKPEMSANEVTDLICSEINNQTADYICLNFANADMVGHTGVFDAIVKAVETVDSCVQKVVEAALENGYTCLITADHGNADKAINKDGSPNTAHTTNKVPCFLVGKNVKFKMQDGILADLAPTILTLMNVEIPSEMTGNVLINKA
ncbi:MAG: 2,3-bisphosphoglycerate-independent phosphoglycerate mutase [Bacteroidia bacterium]|nr:2,3-bisphosphoglycerate-independent phosphoglycerate mutase [Bacteroidia bacterium]NNC86473.1 2,3-bisphosphoglycerate-independent phosphoglycerate mutase [Bacteroidia bacterium]NNM15036.1 2,3-bisphosphoglycerate-independent phosphoglycerate mutase [Bacteroidia bacterium]